VTSADPKVGRTLAATNLAQALAMKEYQVILVDADLRGDAEMRPADLFEIPPDRPGLLQALRGQSPIPALLRTIETPGLSLVTAGCGQPEQGTEARGSGEPSEANSEPALAGRSQENDLPLLGSRQFRSVLDTLRQSGRHLVYDLPPIGTHETVLEAAASLGNVILVARSGQTTRVRLREAAQLLEDRGVKICGILVTDVRADLLEGAPLFPAHGKRRKTPRWSRRSASAAARNAKAMPRERDQKPNPEPKHNAD
jgi:Mrp family chromosome partitioning ATPase